MQVWDICLKIKSLVGMGREVFRCVFIRSQHVEVVTIDLDISTNRQISWGDEFHALVYVLILLSREEWTLDDTRILLSWLEDRNGVISQVEGNDKSSVDIFWHFGVESSREPQDFLIVVHVFKEINLWLLRDKIVDVTERVYFVSETVVWWHLHDHGVSCLHWRNIAHWEVLVVSVQEVVLGELVDSLDDEDSAVGNEVSFEIDLIARQVPVSNELLSGLIHIESLWQFLSSEIHREGVSSVIWEMNFPDLDGVVSKEVVPDELEVLADSEESQDLSIVVQELLLRGNSSSSELLLQELKKFFVLLWWNWLQGLLESVLWAHLSVSLGLADVLQEKAVTIYSKV
jgi:hypothetical protein